MTSWCRSCGQVGVQCNRESLLLTAAALTNAAPRVRDWRTTTSDVDRCCVLGLGVPRP